MNVDVGIIPRLQRRGHIEASGRRGRCARRAHIPRLQRRGHIEARGRGRCGGWRQHFHAFNGVVTLKLVFVTKTEDQTNRDFHAFNAVVTLSFFRHSMTQEPIGSWNPAGERLAQRQSTAFHFLQSHPNDPQQTRGNHVRQHDPMRWVMRRLGESN